MRTITALQAVTVYHIHRRLAEAGFRPDVARGLVLRAVSRVIGPAGAGVGLVRQTRELIRTPGMTPRYVDPTDRCQRIDAPIDEPERLYPQAERASREGWNVMKIVTSQYPYREVWYSCPPGQLPREHQPKIFAAEQF
jgi:hypothetical protein